MKFSDILKKKDAGTPSALDVPPPAPTPPPKSPAPAAPAAPSAPPTPAPSIYKSTPPPAARPPEESDEVIEQRVTAHALKAMEIYSEAVSVARTVYTAAAKNEPIPSLTPVKEALFKIVAVLESGNQELLAMADRATPDNYLFAHVVNVAIFAIRLGQSRGLSHPDLQALSLSAFLHDLGMLPYLSLAQKPALLNQEELAQIQQHPLETRKLLSLFSDLSGPLKDAVHDSAGQVHERIQGNGYPERRAGENIHPFARIIGVCDVYEAVTHPRPQRPRALPHQALRVMIEEHERSFEPGIVKTLIESLSLYPTGSFVRLSSGEIGRVIFTDPGLPTRPKVKMLLDARGNRLPGPKIVNLALQPILYVADAVDETQIQTSDKRLLLELRAQRWWVKGL
ncbi:MAG TPA: HD domain-containing phosphohydrolase [Elusimicrobiota bacterium]|nr:HD domain-containing phosphohydrolase [Elusimicrobiota bacterium]